MASTPNLFVTWSIGKLFINIRESGYANRDDKVDTERNHGTNTPTQNYKGTTLGASRSFSFNTIGYPYDWLVDTSKDNGDSRNICV